MSEREPKPMEIEINEQKYRLLGAKACSIIIYRKPEDDMYRHLAVLDEDASIVARGFNNTDLFDWMAGYRIVRDEDDRIHRHTALYQDQTFEEAYGWSPINIEMEEADDSVKEVYAEIQAKQLEADLEEFERES
jgi:hypothetical protein